MTQSLLIPRLEKAPLICAEGYLFELERRGYLQAGPFVPEVSLEHPEALRQVHRDFCFCGSDVVVAFTYNGHRQKMRQIGKEDLLEPLNRQALRLAREVADEFVGLNLLVAGDISNTNIFDPDDPDSKEKVSRIFAEMVGWAAEEGVDFVIAETIYYHEEALLALRAIREAGLEAVVTLGLLEEGVLSDGFTVEESCAILEAEGASVVGLNCFRGPDTIMEPLLKIREKVSIPVAGLPVPYRTTSRHPTFFNLPDPGNKAVLPHPTTFPSALDPLYCNRYEIAEWAGTAHEKGINYLGLCCGATPAFIRSLAEAVGKTTPASRYSIDMSRHFMFGTDPGPK
ncbi:MAG: homocysteine S-methyltransferase family protein [Desulfurivibrionaceae bacterium]